MSDLREILREEYIKQVNMLDLKTLLEMVEDVMSKPLTLAEDSVPTVDNMSAEDTLAMTLKMIPNIEVSEIGWSDVRTVKTGDEEKTVSGPQRALLEDYLENIKGTTFQERIQNVSRFYENGAGIIADSGAATRAEKITQAISYLVFYKTLTKVITNFNASSAGFSFESFLSALCRGQQIPPGKGTIADYTDNLSGDGIPVSLKLYREGGLEVGGSYTDLVNDLESPRNPQAIGGGMRYVVCTKELEGENLEQEGGIKFWQFDFTLSNVMWILVNSKQVSAECIRIPQAVVSKITGKGAENRREQYENILGLPSKTVMPSPQEIYTDVYTPKLKSHLAIVRGSNKPLRKGSRGLLNYVLRSDLEFDDMLSQLNWDTNDSLFSDYIVVIPHKKGEEPELDPATGKPIKQRENKGKIRGFSSMNFKGTNDWAKDWAMAYWKTIEEDPQKNPTFYKLLYYKPGTDQPMTERDRKKLLDNLGLDLSAVLRSANNAKRTWGKDEKKDDDYDARLDDANGVLGIFRASEIDNERKAMIRAVLESEGGFLSPEASAKFYGGQDDRYKKIILKHTLGYLTTMHFSLNQTQATDSAPPGEIKYDKNDETGEDIKVQGGTGAIELGTIKVGATYVIGMLDAVKDILNDEIREIFDSLKQLSDNLNKFFSGGLQEDSLATLAVGNANNITSKKVLRGSGGAGTQSGPAQRASRVYDAGGYGGAPTYEE
jgi:hypothetical protein